MSRQYSQFPFGNPPLDTDRFLVGRVDVTSPSGFSNFIMTWAEIRAAVGAGTPGADGRDGTSIPGLDGEDGLDSFTSGPVGLNGIPGINGINGIDGTDGEDGVSIPGISGVNGIDGLTIPPDLPEDPPEPLLVPGPTGIAGAIGNDGIGIAGRMFSPFAKIPITCPPALRLQLKLARTTSPFTKFT